MSYQNEVQELLKNRLELDDTFEFKCDQCGKCCQHREDLLLTPVDMIRIAKRLDMTMSAVFEKYCETYIGSDSRLPIVRMVPKGRKKVCPLLKKGRCRVHDAKPSKCALYPLGRVNTPDEVFYVNTNPPCGKRGHKQAVREWLKQFNIPADDKTDRLLHETHIYLHHQIKKWEEILPPHHMAKIFIAVFNALYIGYDTSKEFHPQLEDRAKALKDLFDKLEKSGLDQSK